MKGLPNLVPTELDEAAIPDIRLALAQGRLFGEQPVQRVAVQGGGGQANPGVTRSPNEADEPSVWNRWGTNGIGVLMMKRGEI